MNRLRSIICICLVILMLLLQGCLGSKRYPDERNKMWVEDIQQLQEKLPERHSNLFANITQGDFNSKMDKLKKDVPNINDDEIQIRLMEIFASVGDSHLYIINLYRDVMRAYLNHDMSSCSLKELLPIKTMWFDKSLVVVEADGEYKELLGARVNGINGIPAAEAMGKINTIISHTNSQRLKYLNVMMLCHPQVLRHFNLLKDDKLSMEFTSQEGKAIAKEIKIKKSDAVSFVGVMDSLSEKPLYMSSDELYWYSYLPEKKAAYLRLRSFGQKSVEDMKVYGEKETDNTNNKIDRFKEFNKFLNDMIDDMKEKNPEKIIIDLRGNNGGFSSVLDPLREYIRKNDSIPKQGKVFLLVDNGCLSGSVWEASNNKESDKALVVGEPTGEGPFVGSADSASLTLPNTKLSIQYATSEFKNLNEGVYTIIPDILAETTFEDYKNGVDPVLNAVFDYK